jgi:hypothetical protein
MGWVAPGLIKDHSPGLLDPEDESTIILCYIGNFSPNDTVSYLRVIKSSWSTTVPVCDSNMVTPYCESSPLTTAVRCTVCVFFDRMKICRNMKCLCSNKQQRLLNCVRQIQFFLQREHPWVQYDTKSKSRKGNTWLKWHKMFPHMDEEM